MKGITVYRDGSRSGVLITSEKEEQFNSKISSVKRPKKIEATVVRFMNIEEKWITVIGTVNNKPYEIFTGKLHDLKIPEWVESGWIIKTKNETNEKEYNFHFVDKNGKKAIIKGLSKTFNKEYWNYAKLISGVLRYGMPLHKVVDLVHNLNLYDSSINTWKYGVERALKKFTPNGIAPTDKTCPNCKAPNGLIYEEGCLKCKNCTYSKC